MSDKPERTATAIANANIAIIKFTLAKLVRTDCKVGCEGNFPFFSLLLCAKV